VTAGFFQYSWKKWMSGFIKKFFIKGEEWNKLKERKNFPT
jgi:hypothetical protein